MDARAFSAPSATSCSWRPTLGLFFLFSLSPPGAGAGGPLGCARADDGGGDCQNDARYLCKAERLVEAQAAFKGYSQRSESIWRGSRQKKITFFKILFPMTMRNLRSVS